jgi:hypothetical protein
VARRHCVAGEAVDATLKDLLFEKTSSGEQH